MLVWFIVGSLVAVSLVFDSPALDHRFVAGGAVLPVAEGLVGGPWLLHTLVAGVAVLAVVMLLTRGRRPGRQRWLGVPIGMFIHLVLDGTWTDTGLFWWPVAGMDELGGSVVPEFARLPGTLLLEACLSCVCRPCRALAYRLFWVRPHLARRSTPSHEII